MKAASRMQAQTMIGILALGANNASGANIRTLHYRWLRSSFSHSGIYSVLRRLCELRWVKKRTRLCLMTEWEHKRTTPVYALTEAGRKALLNYIADTLWLDNVDRIQARRLRTEARRLLDETVKRVRRRA